MDDLVRCPTCHAEFDAHRLWAEDEAKCRHCGADLPIVDVLADALDAEGHVPDESARQLDAFPPKAAVSDEPTDDDDLERTLSDALDLFAQLEDEGGLRVSDVLTDEIRHLLRELGVEEPAADAPPEAVERALAEARLALVTFDPDTARVDALVDAVGDIDPDQLINDEPTDPSIYLDELPPVPPKKR